MTTTLDELTKQPEKRRPTWRASMNNRRYTYRAYFLGPTWVIKEALTRWQVYRAARGSLLLVSDGKRDESLVYVQSFDTVEDAKDFVEVMWRMEE